MLRTYLAARARYEEIEQQCDHLLAPVDFGELPALPDKDIPLLKRLQQRRDSAYRRVLVVENQLSPEERVLLKQMKLWV